MADNRAVDPAYAFLERPGWYRLDKAENSSGSAFRILHNAFLPGNCAISLVGCFRCMYQTPSHRSTKDVGCVTRLCQRDDMLLSHIGCTLIL